VTGPNTSKVADHGAGLSDVEYMTAALSAAAEVRNTTAPNPWVGCVIVAADGATHVGATGPPGGPHAEAVALKLAGSISAGSTMFTTLEPCNHHGRTGPCSDAIIEAGIARVVVGVVDPDNKVAGSGIARLREAGIDVTVGICGEEVASQLESYLHQRRTGRPFVTLKMAATLDGQTAAADGSSQWITSAQSRADVHALRVCCDGILVGAGTVRRDDPELTVRHVSGRNPRRFVLGTAGHGAKVQPCTEVSGDIGSVLDTIGSLGIVDLLVEGGARTAAAFHHGGFVNRYLVYLAPRFIGGDDGLAMFSGPGAPTIADAWTGRMVDVRRIGDDLRLELRPKSVTAMTNLQT